MASAATNSIRKAISIPQRIRRFFASPYVIVVSFILLKLYFKISYRFAQSFVQNSRNRMLIYVSTRFEQSTHK